jgi:CheY-like chemotaxis protein
MKQFNNVLLVDDDRIANFVTEKLLRKMKVSDDIQVALNGEEALEIIKTLQINNQCCPGLILLDINMPVMDGLEFINQFSNSSIKDKLHCKIVMLTTSTNPKDLEALDKKGIKHIINKPLTSEKFVKVLLDIN